MNREKSKKEQCQVSEAPPQKAVPKKNKERQQPGRGETVREVKLCCTTCPSECVMTVLTKGDMVLHVEGNTCKRGRKFAEMELIAPQRTLTSTILVESGGKMQLLPVKTAAPIPKRMLVPAMAQIRETQLTGALTMGDVVIPNICDSGVDLVACRSLKEENDAR